MKKILIFIIVLSFMFSNCGCTQKKDYSATSSNKFANTKADNESRVGIKFKDNTPENNKKLYYISNSDNLSFKLHFFNKINRSRKYSLVIYLDYRQVTFNIGDKKNVSFYYIYANKGTSDQLFNIGFNLSQYAKGSHKLDILLLDQTNPLLNEANINTHNLSYSYKIDYKKVANSDIGIENNNLVGYEVINEKVPFEINLNRNQIENHEYSSINKTIRVKAGQDFLIPFVTSDILSSKEYVLHFNLNNNQWKIDGKDYLTINIDGEKSIFKKLKIKAPMHSGSYYGTFILSRNPLNTFSDRFTIIVE